MPRPIAIVQARMGSTRLPGKVLRTVAGKPMLWHIAQRLRAAKGLSDVVVATSTLPGDEPIRRFCDDASIPCVAGDEKDVLDRFYRAASAHRGDPLVRITADCPFVDPDLVRRLLEMYGAGAHDYVAIATGAGALFLEGGRFPDGLDAECFSFAALERAWREAGHPLDREHVTPYIWRNHQVFRCGHLMSDADYSRLRWTVDNEADFTLVSAVYDALYREDRPFVMRDILDHLAAHPELAALNREFVGQEGYRSLWELGSRPAEEPS